MVAASPQRHRYRGRASTPSLPAQVRKSLIPNRGPHECRKTRPVIPGWPKTETLALRSPTRWRRRRAREAAATFTSFLFSRIGLLVLKELKVIDDDQMRLT